MSSPAVESQERTYELVARPAAPVDADIETATAVKDFDEKKDDEAEPKKDHVVPAKEPKTPLQAVYTFFFEDDEDVDDSNVPKLSWIQLFIRFLWFGCRAFGGPVAQIALMKQELITQEKWIPAERFTRVYSVYQVLPGPEAMELACYFGFLVKGRLGSIVGGMGFLLPGFLMMLLASYLYKVYGIESRQVQRSFQCLQCVVAATIFKATYKLSDSALKDPKTKQMSTLRGFLFLFSFLTSTIGLNFFISLAVTGLMNAVYDYEKVDVKIRYAIVCFMGAFTLGMYILYVELNGIPGGSLIGSGGSSSVNGRELKDLFALGLVAGMVTFGGAYTTFPFIYAAAVQGGQWLSNTDFLAAIAIVNILPTPLVTFVTLVGYIGHGIGGAIVITIGIFLPAFSFTLIGHRVFEKMVNNDFVHPFLDGIGAAVIGFLLQTAFQFLRNVILEPIDAISFLLAFAALFHFTDRNTPVYCMLVGAIAGQILYL